MSLPVEVLAEGGCKEMRVDELWMGCTEKEKAEHYRKLKIRQELKMSR